MQMTIWPLILNSIHNCAFSLDPRILRIALFRYRNIIGGLTKEQPRKILTRDDRHKRDQSDIEPEIGIQTDHIARTGSLIEFFSYPLAILLPYSIFICCSIKLYCIFLSWKHRIHLLNVNLIISGFHWTN